MGIKKTEKKIVTLVLHRCLDKIGMLDSNSQYMFCVYFFLIVAYYSSFVTRHFRTK